MTAVDLVTISDPERDRENDLLDHLGDSVRRSFASKNEQDYSPRRIMPASDEVYSFAERLRDNSLGLVKIAQTLFELASEKLEKFKAKEKEAYFPSEHLRGLALILSPQNFPEPLLDPIRERVIAVLKATFSELLAHLPEEKEKNRYAIEPIEKLGFFLGYLGASLDPKTWLSFEEFNPKSPSYTLECALGSIPAGLLDPWIAEVRGDPRYEKLLKRLKPRTSIIPSKRVWEIEDKNLEQQLKKGDQLSELLDFAARSDIEAGSRRERFPFIYIATEGSRNSSFRMGSVYTNNLADLHDRSAAISGQHDYYRGEHNAARLLMSQSSTFPEVTSLAWETARSKRLLLPLHEPASSFAQWPDFADAKVFVSKDLEFYLKDDYLQMLQGKKPEEMISKIIEPNPRRRIRTDDGRQFSFFCYTNEVGTHAPCDVARLGVIEYRKGEIDISVASEDFALHCVLKGIRVPQRFFGREVYTDWGSEKPL